MQKTRLLLFSKSNGKCADPYELFFSIFLQKDNKLNELIDYFHEDTI